MALASKKVLAAASSEHGAKNISPVLLRLHNWGKPEIMVVSTGPATAAFRSFGIEPEHALGTFSKGSISSIILSFNPDAILTGVNRRSVEFPVPLEQMLWLLHPKNTLALYGLGKNPQIFFMGQQGKAVDLPEKIGVFNEAEKERLAGMGVDSKKLVVTGNQLEEYLVLTGDKKLLNSDIRIGSIEKVVKIIEEFVGG